MIARTYIGLGKTSKKVKSSATNSLVLYELKQHKTLFNEMFTIFRSKEAD